MGAPTSGRPSGPVLPGDQAGGPAPDDPDDPVALGPDADPEAVARKILLDQLTGRPRTRAELATKLAGRRVPAEVADRLLTRFEEVGLIDDEQFARAWVESRQAGRGLARRALAHELRRKGVQDEVIREVLDAVDPEQELDAARRLVRRKLSSLRRVNSATKVRRLTGMLARKGYSAGLAARVVHEELAATEADRSEGLFAADG